MQPQGQPQSPYPQQPYPPQGPPQEQPLPGQPGQQYGPAAQPYPGTAGAGQPMRPLQPQIPGQPPMPAYQMPKGPSAPSSLADMAPAPDAPSTPYDFFMQPKPTPSLTPLPANGKRLGSPLPKQAGGKKNIVFLLGGALALLLVIITGISLLAPKDPAASQLFGIAQTQQELIRICSQASTRAKYQATRNFAMTCSTGITNSQKQLLAYMGKANYSYDSKLLGGKASSQTSSKLSQAESTSTYDDTFREIAKANLSTYSRLITAQLAATTGQNGREVLTKNEKSAELLSQMVADDSDKTEATTSE